MWRSPGEERVYETVLLRRTYREAGKVKHETLANLSKVPTEAVAALEATLKGQALVPAGSEFTLTRALPHGHVAAVAAMAHRLKLPALLGPRCRSRELCSVLIISRVLRPASKLSTLAGLARHHPRCRSGGGRRVHRRGLRRDGLAG